MKEKVSLIDQFKKGRFSLVEIMVCYDGNNDYYFDPEERDVEGISLLEYAIIYGKESVAIALMEKHHCKFDYNHKDGNRPSPVGLAIKFHRNNVLKKMIELMSEVEKVRILFAQSFVYCDIRLLSYAVMYKNLDAMNMLLDAGAMIGLGDDGGKTALSVAAIKAVGKGDHSTQMLILRELLRRLASYGEVKKHIIDGAIRDLQSYAVTLDADQPKDAVESEGMKIISKVETILESAKMY